MHITKGYFGKVKLDDLYFCVVVHFPGALHEGNGSAQPILDERASPEQRDALAAILSGENSAEGTLFHIVSLIVTKMHDPIIASFTFKFDQDARVAKMVIPGVLETESEPIKNPVTGLPHRAQVVMPEGFEHIMAEIASSNIRSTGAIKFQTTGGHSSLAHVVHTPQGVVA
jgi:hypothetical protein